ncbi:MAG: hypothetical protein U5K72_08170 [Balneolaceae bacterium]|nr:hypothetical protein [Balneolaceae bacterium]
MRILVIITGFVISLLAFTPQEATAQRNLMQDEEPIEYSVEVNRGAYRSMVQRVGDRGISEREFGEWVAKNSSLRKRPGRIKIVNRQMITVINENGRVV